MKVKFEFDSDLCWHTEGIIEVKDNICNLDIESMFQEVLGVPYDDVSCRYKAITGKIYTLDEILAYTE